MKNINNLIATIILLSGSFLLSSSALAQNYIGDVCWQVNDNDEGSEGDDFIRLAVVEIGNDHYSVSGYAYSEGLESASESEILNGNVEVIDGQIFMALSGAYNDDEEIGTIKYHATLSPITLGGTFEAIGTFFDKESEEISSGVGSGSLQITDCAD